MERLDGKYLLRTSDDTLPTEDVASGYKQLLKVEAAFLERLSRLWDLRPVCHRKEGERSQRTELTQGHKGIVSSLNLDEPS